MGSEASRGRRHLLLAMGVCAALLAGCRTTQVQMNEPLAPGTGATGYRLEQANAAGGAPDIIVLVSLSGGGKRSASFAHGALAGMRELPVVLGGRSSNLLAEVDQLSGVSGGSFPAAHYGLYGEESFATFRRDFLDRDIEAFIYGTYLLPWNWEWLVNPLYGTNDRMADVYDRLMFRGATFADLMRRGRPQVAITATDVSYGQPFAFIPYYFGLICSDLGRYPVARAVAASNGFPVLFTPVTLQNHREGCAGPQAGPGQPPAELRARALYESRARYLDATRTRWVHLMDGGISDNLAMRASLNAMMLIAENPEAEAESLLHVRRILMVSIDGEAAADPNWPRQRVVTSIGQVLSAASGAQIDNYNVETLLLGRSESEHLARVIAGLRCARAPVIDGAACDDVRGEVVHVALSNFPDRAVRERLQAIPTGLTIPAEDVTALMQAGSRMVRDSPELRHAIARLAPEPAQGAPRRVVGTPRRR